MCLIYDLHKSILWVVCMISVEHGLETLKAGPVLFCLFFTLKMYSNCSYTLWPCLCGEPQWHRCDLLGLGVDTCQSEGEQRGSLVTPTVVMFPLSDFTGRSQWLLFGLSALLLYHFSLSTIFTCLLLHCLTMKTYLATHISFLQLFFYLLFFLSQSNRGWFVGTPGTICVSLSLFFFCETGAIPQHPRFVYEAFHIRVHYSDLLP